MTDKDTSVPVKKPRKPRTPKVSKIIKSNPKLKADATENIVDQLHDLKQIMINLEDHADKLTTEEKIIGSYNIGLCLGIISIASNLIGLETQDSVIKNIHGFLDRIKNDDYTGSDCQYDPIKDIECEQCKSKELCLLLKAP